ncbi:MAG: FISUMP domain-containing protein, partial [Bacteroidales bacterium]
PTGRQVKIDSLLNNQKNCVISADSFTLSEPTAGGYRLRFALTNADTVAGENARIYLVSKHQAFFTCKGCGAAGSDIAIDSASIDPTCPYKDVNVELLACTRRTGGAKNWEGFIVDHRDCKVYRIVAMPELSGYNKGNGRWWFAQNLNYTKNLIMNKDAATNSGLGSYWCMGGPSFNGKPIPLSYSSTLTTVSGGEASCDTYGPVYSYNTMMSRNGLAPTQDSNSSSNINSVAQGICPQGWVVPSRRDMAIMFNKAAGCFDNLATIPVDPNSQENAPCNHLSKGAVSSEHNYHSSLIPLRLRSLLSGHRTILTDSIFATAKRPVWPWVSMGKKRLHGARPTDYYGFSLIPAGRWSANSFEWLGGYTFLNTSTLEYWQISPNLGDHRQVPLPTLAQSLRCTRSYNLDQ